MADAEASRWISTFLEAQAAEAGASRNTCLAYGRDLTDFSAWAARKAISLARATQSDVEAYLIHCDTRGLAKSTRARRLSSIRQMYRLAVDEGWRSDNPALRISGPGKVHRLPATLSHADVTRLIDAAASKGRTPDERARNRAIFELLYATGMRVSELASLPVSAVRGDPRMILVRGKGSKERMVPLSGPARAALTDWLALHDKAAETARAAGRPTAKFLFPGPGAAGHLSRQHLHLLVKDTAVLAGIDPTRVTPHTLRHAFATHLLAGGADLRVIQTLLGHADVATTEIYTHVLDEHLKALVLTHHPLARKS